MKKILLAAALVSAFYGTAGPALAAEHEAAKVSAPIADLSEGRKAQEALEELVRAYEAGNVGLIRNRLDPAMIGYQRFIDGVIQDSSRLKLIRIHLKDTQVLAGPDVAVIQTNWEKRFLSATGLAPGLFTGHSMFLLHRDNGGWKVAAFGGDNLFASQSGVLAQLGLVNANTPLAPSVNIEVIEPDMAGAISLTVTLTHSGGTFYPVLNEMTPGRFVSPSPVGVSTGVVTLRYLDANPGGGRPPSWLGKSITLP